MFLPLSVDVLEVLAAVLALFFIYIYYSPLGKEKHLASSSSTLRSPDLVSPRRSSQSERTASPSTRSVCSSSSDRSSASLSSFRATRLSKSSRPCKYKHNFISGSKMRKEEMGRGASFKCPSWSSGLNFPSKVNRESPCPYSASNDSSSFRTSFHDSLRKSSNLLSEESDQERKPAIRQKPWSSFTKLLPNIKRFSLYGKTENKVDNSTLEEAVVVYGSAARIPSNARIIQRLDNPFSPSSFELHTYLPNNVSYSSGEDLHSETCRLSPKIQIHRDRRLRKRNFLRYKDLLSKPFGHKGCFSDLSNPCLLKHQNYVGRPEFPDRQKLKGVYHAPRDRISRPHTHRTLITGPRLRSGETRFKVNKKAPILKQPPMQVRRRKMRGERFNGGPATSSSSNMGFKPPRTTRTLKNIRFSFKDH